jgi:hypothetical protein
MMRRAAIFAPINIRRRALREGAADIEMAPIEGV